MGKLSRRQFLQAAGVTGLAAIAGGCSDATRRLIPFVSAPEDIVPGEATWYATTCRECPAGCGMLAKNRDGRVIKVEGNPVHPINEGKLCARGQASVQGIYNPDRYRTPLRRLSGCKFAPIHWDEAEKSVLNALTSAIRQGRGGRVVFLTDLTTGAEKEMIRRFLGAAGSGRHIMYEPFAYEALRQANSDVFGIDAIPRYRLSAADFLISFGANFLETWISNVQYAREFAAFRDPARGNHHFVYVGPRLSVTGANADRWISVPVGGEPFLALGLLRALLHSGYASALTKEDAARISVAVADFTPELVESRTGVKRETLDSLAEMFSRAKRPLVLAEGMGYQGLRPSETAVAANLLCSLVPASSEMTDFSSRSALSECSRAKDIKALTDRVRAGEVDILFILRANPVFHLPPQWAFMDALKSVPLVVSFSSFPDETAQAAHLILPTHTFLESWGDFSPRTDVRSLMQPVTGPIFDTRPLGDILLSLGRSLKGTEAFPERDFYEVLQRSWESPAGGASPQKADGAAWQEALQRGGSWGLPERSGSPGSQAKRRPISAIRPFVPSPLPPGKQQVLSFISYPTIQFFDGRTANRPFLQELPDPMTAVTWSGWIEINPETAERLGIRKGDLLLVRSDHGSVQAAAYPYPGIRPDTVAMPIGQGHRAFGRYAVSEAGNPAQVTSGSLDEAGGLIWALAQVTITNTGSTAPLAHTDGSSSQHDRGIVRSMSAHEYVTTAGNAPDVVLPLRAGFRKDRDFYPPHMHDAYRWCMAVDLDRCIGCGACVVACYAENNVATVGRAQVLKGREMAWLHIQRYFESREPFVRFLPMLCQHCDEAPCESVCPVFAPNHSKEGINNQVYNRCIGTRYCSQNCPYKVRRFNWFTWRHDPPLQWQLNPDVTVRTKGVMEKCSFCIQRIVAAKVKARSENRLVRDGEFSPACVQTCPVDALIFGNLKDPKGRVARLVSQSRAYQVLGELNTKPGVIYLKKIIRSTA